MIKAALFTLVAVAFLAAQPDQQGTVPSVGKLPQHQPEQLRQALNLTDQQVAQLKQIRQKHRQSMQRSMDQVAQLHKQLTAVYTDGRKSEQLAVQIGEHHRQLALLTRQHLMEIDQILNDDQMKKFIEFRNQKGGHPKHKKGPK